ncbi:hypothetical protein Egran_05164, partial [Elaphomyces granulatus]
EIDPDGRSRSFHIQNVVVYCRVHFLRNIEEAVGKRKAQEVSGRMTSLLDCGSRDDYFRLCDLLMNRETNPKVVEFVRHKRNPDIACGLNKFCSQIPGEIFDRVRHHTNAAEQSHNKAYSFGRRQTLLQGLTSGWKLDRRDVDQHKARSDFGIRHAYRTDDMEANYSRHQKREETRRRRRTEQAQAQAPDPIDDEPALGINFDSPPSSPPTPSRSGSVTGRQRSTPPRPRSRATASRARSAQPNLRQLAAQNVQDLDQRQRELELRRLETEQQRLEEDRQLELRRRETEQNLLEEQLRRERLANDAMETANERIQYFLQRAKQGDQQAARMLERDP